MARYRNLFLLLVGFTLAILAVEAVLRMAGAPFSVTDRKGPGQIIVFAIAISAMTWFSVAIGGINPLTWFAGYLRDWRRMLRGFLTTFLLATATMIVIYAVLIMLGKVQWSHEAWENLTPKIWWRTAVALLVVVILATTEETIFRGFILRYLRWKATPAVTLSALLVSSAIFSLSHLIALLGSVNQPDYLPLLFGLFLFGFLMGTVYLATGSLSCSIGLHAGLLGFKVFLRRTDLLIQPENWLTGGADLRTGPAMWVLLLLAALAFFAFREWLWPRLWIEKGVSTRENSPEGLGFRLDG
ncbi:MAG: CPBP family intramembrane metalloprotease [Mesorhizobium sp.]|nr:type II CAAX endopeptidase family protein [Mesorhizobium sp.]MBN9245105.1 CPBP family intramembrane metalloprotease [Mesorhizobium sp.]